MRRAWRLMAALPTASSADRAVNTTLSRAEALQAVQRARSPDELHAVVSQFRDSKPDHGQVAFINAVMDRVPSLKEPVSLTTFDTLLDVFPKDATYKNRSLLDAIWPRESLQSNAALRVLQFMEDDGLIPESSTHAVLLETFGRASGPVKKVTYMAYWMRRYFFSNPFALPRQVPETDQDWIYHALQRYAGADADIHGFELTDTVKLTQPSAYYAVSKQQETLLQNLDQLAATARIAIAGRQRAWISGRKQHYLCLVARHDTQEHVLSVCSPEPPTKPLADGATAQTQLLHAAVDVRDWEEEAARGLDPNAHYDAELEDWRRVGELWSNALGKRYPELLRRFQVVVDIN
eukprot:m.102873 g.102873  ORF g.102873 m.102873 type:complete len:349 (-) comp15202_c0_seq6:1111-2157(-)